MTPARRLFVLLSLAAAPGLGHLALASLGGTHRPSSLPWSDVVKIPSFDPAQGQLVAVHLSIDTFVRTDLRAENLGAGPQLVDARAVANVSVRLPNGLAIADLPFDSGAQWVLASFDGAVDFAGTSGRSTLSTGRRHADVWIDDPALLLDFVALPKEGGYVELPVSAAGQTSMLGGRPLSEFTALDAGVRVRAEYILAPNG